MKFLAAILCCLACAAPAHAALTDGLVAYFPFDGDYVDAVGVFDGTPVSGSPTFPAEQKGWLK